MARSTPSSLALLSWTKDCWKMLPGFCSKNHCPLRERARWRIGPCAVKRFIYVVFLSWWETSSSDEVSGAGVL